MKWPSPGPFMAVVCLAAIAVSCSTKTPPATAPAPQTPVAVTPTAPAPPAPSVPAQSPAAAQQPQGTTAPKPTAPPPLLGHLTRADLQAYESWESLFAPQTPYVPGAASIATIKAHARGVTVLLIMATWCPDSKREVPRYFAIMDAAGVPDSTLTMVSVDRSKKDTEGLTEKLAITRVPTFVFFRGGQEIGRFVERLPAGSASTLEAEIAKIVGAK